MQAVLPPPRFLSDRVGNGLPVAVRSDAVDDDHAYWISVGDHLNDVELGVDGFLTDVEAAVTGLVGRGVLVFMACRPIASSLPFSRSQRLPGLRHRDRMG